MAKNKIHIILISFVFTICVFSTPVLAADLPEIKQDKGLVVFYRMSGFKGKAIRFNLNHSEGSIGQLLSGTYIYKYLDPGEHKFWSQAISQDSITVNVEMGKIYYVKGEVKMGCLLGARNLPRYPSQKRWLT